ncbi:hypothetical protein RFI_10534 [Reticulomyxa filosa]|uniref:Uncharacterized protein n=1 Tax=Reticulomyxa filosa TaxID=46433 RepID=X6NMH2_RETFI|nr:hypothetical protein RFI_10534 [Reticulomyxa filosa]|eukprot:ETO26602.1 hypothetical protein RFI_10534 [Reticulomyxa filosa]
MLVMFKALWVFTLLRVSVFTIYTSAAGLDHLQKELGLTQEQFGQLQSQQLQYIADHYKSFISADDVIDPLQCLELDASLAIQQQREFEGCQLVQYQQIKQQNSINAKNTNGCLIQ